MENTQKNLMPFVLKINDDGGKYFNLLNKENASKMHSGFVTLKPGETVGSHTTGKNEEIIVVVEGSGEIEAGGVKRPVTKGDIGYNPPDTEHNVINNSDSVLKYIFVVSEA
jgi:quercetin dioxygenase-like cupin family protein